MPLRTNPPRSIQDELEREGNADAGTVVFSYLAMLAYIAVALSKGGGSCSDMAIHSRVGLGVAGVALVGVAVLAAMGLCALLGVWSTLIIMEVGGDSWVGVLSVVCRFLK